MKLKLFYSLGIAGGFVTLKHNEEGIIRKNNAFAVDIALSGNSVCHASVTLHYLLAYPKSLQDAI